MKMGNWPKYPQKLAQIGHFKSLKWPPGIPALKKSKQTRHSKFDCLAWRHSTILKNLINFFLIYENLFIIFGKTKYSLKINIRYSKTNTNNKLVFVFVFKPNIRLKRIKTKKKRNEANIRHSLKQLFALTVITLSGLH
jgi:hypothetical protein